MGLELRATYMVGKSVNIEINDDIVGSGVFMGCFDNKTYRIMQF